MFDRMGRDASGRLGWGPRPRPKAVARPIVEPLEGRALMTASLAAIGPITSPQFQGFQVPLLGGTTHAQTFAVTSSNPSVKATVAQGKFLTIGVSHASSGTGDPTVNGTMTFQLFDDLTPKTTNIIESLVNGTATNLASGVTIGSDYYVGKTFHRVANGFPDANSYIVQGGSLNGDGTGNVFATPFPDEFVQQLAFTGSGQLAMANAGSDTNDSQFFITTGSPQFLNYNHTIFGQIVAGDDILNELTTVTKNTSDGTTPTSKINITSATLSAVSPDGVVHIDTTNAPVGATSTINVTATDSTDGTTASQSFVTTVGPLTQNAPDRPFIPLTNYDPAITLGENQVAKLQINAVATPPSDPLTYTVQGGVSTSNGTTTFTPLSSTDGTATVSATGLVTLTPATGFTGTFNLLVGVQDQTNRAGTGVALSDPSNFKYHIIAVTVNSSTTAVALRPLAANQAVTAVIGAPTTIQLAASNPNATTTLPLTYAITGQPTNGTVTNLNASTGAFTYTPNAGYTGPDTITYTATDPNSSKVSFPATVNITVNQASTGAVRFFADDQSTSTTVPGVLTVTPLPRTDGGTNTINVTQVNGNVQVTVNGVVDILQPTVGNTDRVVVYGSTASDKITIDPSLTIPVTLNGGTGGTNTLTAGGGNAVEEGWYGTNTLVQGAGSNSQFGRKGHVTFVKGTGTSTIIFAGTPGHFIANKPHKERHLPTPTTGTFFTFQGTKLVKTTSPYKVVKTPTTTTTTTTAASVAIPTVTHAKAKVTKAASKK